MAACHEHHVHAAVGGVDRSDNPQVAVTSHILLIDHARVVRHAAHVPVVLLSHHGHQHP